MNLSNNKLRGNNDKAEIKKRLVENGGKKNKKKQQQVYHRSDLIRAMKSHRLRHVIELLM